MLGTLLDLMMEGYDFVIQLANRGAVESMYVWESPTYVIRCCSERFWNMRRFEFGDELRKVLALAPMLYFIQSSQCVDLVK